MPDSHYTSCREGTPRRTRVVLFGMRCPFTQPFLTALSEASDVDLAAVVLPNNANSLPATRSGSAHDAIREEHTRLIEVADRAHLSTPEFRITLESLAPDVIIVACFPWRLPQGLLSLPPCGCLNVHPSLLPDGRGPDPVFWAFRWGLAETGVTLHVMDEELDTGPVVSQRRLVIPEAATIPDLEWSLARMGAGMVMEYVSMVPDRPLSATPQHEHTARYAPAPRQDDLIVSTASPAPDAARFIHAVAPTYGPISVLVLATGRRLAVTSVVQVYEDAPLPQPVIVAGDTATIQFGSGTLVCRLVSASAPLKLR